jgi:hypothetical protein
MTMANLAIWGMCSDSSKAVSVIRWQNERGRESTHVWRESKNFAGCLRRQ